MKIPAWVGSGYSKLYATFGLREFQFGDALKFLGTTDQKLRILLSAMRGAGLLDVLGRRERKRIYKLVDLPEVALLDGKGIDLGKLPEAVRPIVRSYLKGIFDRYGERLISVILYGSFARGNAGPDSDIDLLLVIDGYDWSERVSVDKADELSYRLWKLGKGYHRIQPYPLSVERARYHRPLYLDMTADAIILYDKGDFMRRVFDEIRSRLVELGAKRCELPDGSWYWVLKPEIKPGEVIEV